MLQPTDELTLVLTVAEANQMLDILQGGPYRTVAPIIGKIVQQAQQQQEQQQQEQREPEQREPGNGLAEAISYLKGDQKDRTTDKTADAS